MDLLMTTSPCKGCGKPIVWARTPDGKRIPLDPRPPVYLWSANETEDGYACFRADKTESTAYFVSHFATCPKANDFSASAKGTPQ